MGYTGTIVGNRIELDEPTRLPDGTRVRVDVIPEASPRKGSPAAVLKLAGTLTHEEADVIREAVKSIRGMQVS